jgi:hypothetical protein
MTSLTIFLFLLFYLAACIVVGWLARSKNRSGFNWFLLAVFLSPIFAILALIVVPAMPSQFDDVLYLRKQPPLPRKIFAVIVIGLIVATAWMLAGAFKKMPPEIIAQTDREDRAAAMPSSQQTEYVPQVGRMLPVERLAVSPPAATPTKPTTCSFSPTIAQWREIKRTAEITGMSANAVYGFMCALGVDH